MDYNEIMKQSKIIYRCWQVPPMFRKLITAYEYLEVIL